MAIDTQVISKLRDLTGAGIADCKAALEETNNDMDKAVEVLRKKGVMKAAKKAERATKEGVIVLAQNQKQVAVVGLACETDFVARNEDFIKTVDSYAQELLNSSDVAGFKQSIETKIKNDLVVKIGENIQLGPCELINGEILGTYLHLNKKVAAVVVLAEGNVELANELAMQVAAMSPKYLEPKDVDPAELQKEKEIYREQLRNEKKPESIWDKIIEGKINKYYQDVCLVKQVYIKDDKLTIEQFVKNQNGKIIKFYRFQI
jgi:elongation factor Ts